MIRLRLGGSSRSMLMETFSVVLGVLLALLMNGWWGDRVHQQHGERALAEVLEELQANREALRDSYEYHGRVMNAVYASESPPGLELFGRGFIFPATLLSTAWETARETDALSAIEYETVLGLGRIYALQERYAHQTRAMSAVLYETLLQEGSDGVLAKHRNLAQIIGSFWYKEAELGREIDPTLRGLGVAIPEQAWGPPIDKPASEQ